MLTALTQKLMGILLEINVIPDQLYKFSSAFLKKTFEKTFSGASVTFILWVSYSKA